MHARWAALPSEPPDHAPALYGHSLTTFEESGQVCVVCFGGTTGEGVNSQSNSVWTWRELEGWREAHVNGQKPDPRGWHGAALHNDKLYVFGGNRWYQAPTSAKPTRQVFGDFWELDLRSWTWQAVTAADLAAPQPPKRSACGMASSEGHILLYGGKNAATDGSAYMGDLWAFSVKDRTWALVSEAGTKGPLPRALATFVATPLGCFLYGGTGASRLPLCDLWQLQQPADASDLLTGATSRFVGQWVQCKCMPMCPVEHTVAAEEKTTRSTHAGERVAVGHDAHAATLASDTLLVVWSGLMGRMPKRGILASMPPAPHLTGNLFALDLADIEHGWAMLPARGIQAEGSIGSVEPKKWAAMARIAKGRLLVHGGFASKAVSSDAHVLEVQGSGGSRGGHKRSASLTSNSKAALPLKPPEPSESSTHAPIEASQGIRDGDCTDVGVASNTPSGAKHDAKSGQVEDGRKRESVRKGGHGPAGIQSMFSSVFGGMYKGMENMGSEAVSAIQKVTPGMASPDGAKVAPRPGNAVDHSQDAAQPQRIKYSTRLPAAAPVHDDASSAAPAGRSDARIAEWLLAHASAASADGIRVLVPISDCLSTERGGTAPKRKSRFRAKGRMGPTVALTEDKHHPAAPGSQKRSFGDTDLNDSPPRTPVTSATGLKLPDDDEEGDSGSPVSLWISPAGPSSRPHHARRWHAELQEADRADVCDVVAHLVAAVGAHENDDETLMCLQRSGSLEASTSFQFSSPAPVGEQDRDIEGWPLAGSTHTSSESAYMCEFCHCLQDLAVLLTRRSKDAQRVHGSEATARASDGGAAQNAEQASFAPALANTSGSSPKEWHTAFVQNMLATDPVVGLGLRVLCLCQAGRSIAINTRTDVYACFSRPGTCCTAQGARHLLPPLGQRACSWLRTVPSARCLRCKDIQALHTEYRRVVPAAMLHPRSTASDLGSLVHVGPEQLRLRDLERILSEFAQLSDLASVSGAVMRPLRGSA